MHPFSATLGALLLCAAAGHAYLYKTAADTAKGYCEDERYGRISVGEKGYNYASCERIFCLQGVYYRQGCDEKPLQGVLKCRRVARPGVFPTCCYKRIECEDEADTD